MRDLTDNEVQDVNNEIYMLRDKLNKMCITDDIDEFIKIQMFSVSSLNKILNICAKRFTEEDIKEV